MGRKRDYKRVKKKISTTRWNCHESRTPRDVGDLRPSARGRRSGVMSDRGAPQARSASRSREHSGPRSGQSLRTIHNRRSQPPRSMARVSPGFFRSRAAGSSGSPRRRRVVAVMPYRARLGLLGPVGWLPSIHAGSPPRSIPSSPSTHFHHRHLTENRPGSLTFRRSIHRVPKGPPSLIEVQRWGESNKNPLLAILDIS